MTLHVILRRYPAGSVAQDDVFTVGTAEEVDELVAALDQDEADDAYVTHLGRPTKVDPLDGEDVPDHVMYLAVRDNTWGYIRYIGTLPGHDQAEAYCPVGDPRSPVTHGTNNINYAAGAGLPLATFSAVIKEFLSSGKLSSSVQWRDESHPSARAS